MKLELERRDDPEVAASTAHSPKQIGILIIARPTELAIGRHHVDGCEVVDREPEAARHSTKATSGYQSPHPGVRHRAHWRDQIVLHGLVIHPCQQAATRHASPAGHGIDTYMPEGREVNQQAAVTGRFPREAVPAAFHGREEMVFPCKVHGGSNVCRTGSLRDQRGVFVKGRIEDAARLIVAFVVGEQ